MGQSQSTALYQAASAGDIPGIQTLLGQSADVNSKEQESQWSALHYAAWAGQERAARELLVGGADVNVRDVERKTPLHLAVLGGHDTTMQALCDHGADVSAADVDGQTPLHKAAAQDQLTLTQELVARGADLDAQLQDGSTAAHLAAWKGHSETLLCLLQNGASTSSKTSDGKTALHEAAKAGQEECCRILLRHGADKAAMDAQSRTPADLALVNDFVRIAEIVRPSPEALQAQRRQQQNTAAPSASAPSAPVWNDGPITYPVVDYPASQPPSRDQAATSSQGNQEGQQGQQSPSDWEPQPEEDWEGVQRPDAVPSQGAQLMEGFGQASSENRDDPGPFWMVPQPIRWAAASLGGFLAFRNPFAQQPPQAADRPSTSHASIEAQEAELEEQQARVAEMTRPRNAEQLTAGQRARLRQQEEEIAELKRKLQLARSDAALSSTQTSAPRGAEDEAAVPGPSSRDRHHIIDLPPAPQRRCRVISSDELSTATTGFSNQIGRDVAGATYRGRLDGLDVAVWVSNSNILPWATLQGSADQLSAIQSDQIVAPKAICRDGSVVLDYNENGSVEDALRGRAPVPGKLPIRLDWEARMRVAQQTAEGLLKLHSASPQLLHTGIRPASVLLTQALGAQLAPPVLASVGFGAQVEGSASFCAPEIRRGESPSRQSDVFSLGVILLQLLTGSEPTGLLQYVQSAASQGRLDDILDSCTAGVPTESTRAVFELALRCTEFHPEARPDLEREVLPKLKEAAEKAKAGQVSALAVEEEPPPHIVCPITQEVMSNPVILADGYTYEESAIKGWLQRGKLVSPMTNAPLPHQNMTPNFVIKSAASTWREQHPEAEQLPEQERRKSDLAAQVSSLNSTLQQRNREAQSGGGAPGPAADPAVAMEWEGELPSVPSGEVSREAMRAHLQQRQRPSAPPLESNRNQALNSQFPAFAS